MFRHDNIPENDKAISSAGLFQNRKEAVTITRGTQERQSLVAGTGDKVQVMHTVSAMQATRLNTSQALEKLKSEQDRGEDVDTLIRFIEALERGVIK